ncbi:hypothetical protein Dimus_005155, partial [Dionaea muscipula]
MLALHEELNLTSNCPSKYCKKGVDKENEPDSSLRLRSADPNDLLIELPSPLYQANSPAVPRLSLGQMFVEKEAKTPASFDCEPFFLTLRNSILLLIMKLQISTAALELELD